MHEILIVRNLLWYSTVQQSQAHSPHKPLSTVARPSSMGVVGKQGGSTIMDTAMATIMVVVVGELASWHLMGVLTGRSRGTVSKNSEVWYIIF